MLRDLAELWFKNNCPPIAPVSDFLRKIDTAIEHHQNCWFQFGPNTTTRGGSWLVYCYEDEFFAFALNQRQISLLKLKPGNVTTSPAGCRMSSGRNDALAATLELPAITTATTERIAGSISYEMLRPPGLPYCLRMTWDHPDGPGVNMFHYPPMSLSPTGSIQFNFQLQTKDAPPVPPGLVLVFFALNTVPETNHSSHPSNPFDAFHPFDSFDPYRPLTQTRSLSDTQAVLLELQSPG